MGAGGGGGAGGGVLGIAGQAFSSVLGVASSLTEGFIASQEEKFKGDAESILAESQARLSDLQAEEIVKRGEKNVARLQEQGRVVRGAQRAALAGQGIEIDTGSAGEVQADTARNIVLDSLQIRNNAWREAWGHRIQSVTLRGGGILARQISRQRASATLLTGGIRALTSFAGSIGGFSGSFPSGSKSSGGGFTSSSSLAPGGSGGLSRGGATIISPGNR